jgi:ABC-type transport system substrate-binding protein
MRAKYLVIAPVYITILLLIGSCTPPHAQEDVIRIRWAHDPETLEPMDLNNQPALDAANLLYVSLLQANPDLVALAPALAEQLPTRRLIGDSLTALDYSIRPAAVWDTGQPVLANDVACTLKLLSCPGLASETVRNQYRFVQAVLPDARDPRRFTLLCRGQAPEYVLASGDFFILPEAGLDPRHQLRRYSLAQLQHLPAGPPADSALRAVARHYQAIDLAHHPSRIPSCAPYRLTHWEKDRYLSFRRAASWWPERLRPTPLVLQAHPRQLTYVIIPEASTAALALRRGEIDVFPQVPARDFANLQTAQGSSANLQFHTTNSHDVVMAGFNTRQPMLADAGTRQALSRLFDASSLLRATQLGGGRRSVGIISPLNQANYNDSLPLIPYSLAEASALLQRAGWQRRPAGWFRTTAQRPAQPLRLRVRYRAEEALFATIALQFRAAADSLGIPVVLQPTESGAFTGSLRAGDFDLYIRTIKGNPFMFNFVPILHSSSVGEGNVMGFGTAASDRLIEAVAAADSPARRALLLRRFQHLLQQEAPLVPLFFLPNRVATRRDLAGLHVSSLKPGYVAATIERAAAVAPNP